MSEELEQAQEIYNLITTYLVTYGFQVLGAIIILIVGIFVAGKVTDKLNKLMLSKDMDVTLSKFTASTIKAIIIVMVAIMVLGRLGISVTPFVAAIGALSLGAGLALQGLLSNYGAGISIIVARPFVVGDTIMVQGVAGVVKEIKLGYTILTNEDAVIITIPNRHIIGEIIHNSNASSSLELSIGIAYHCNPGQAITVISKVFDGLKGLDQNKAPQIGIDNFGDSSINISIRCWVMTTELFDTKYRINMAVHKALTENNIEIPFPQRDVHLIRDSDS
ncbi:MAG: mechanosensitive ion channel protein MscS [SAR86 cluster bacterium]|uniref:Small-conductance mechanosensitive channel n=1 Tax=SAR86 cluster bacterium TaxID=2030880 RepID=A0A2A5CD96_9GAMM|nr:mechanosensitive ion channel family protein [Gammaproteobacteria bacterium AH-315-E17]PCJ41485.1 MAG: mechanosensitive ion channel protein MscS [SAR86 cluster bacterium]